MVEWFMAVILKITKDVSFMGSNPIFSEYSMYYPPLFINNNIYITKHRFCITQRFYNSKWRRGGVDKFVGFYSSMVELDTVNIMIGVRFILGAKKKRIRARWLGASFGSRNSYVRFVIIRTFILNRDVK